MRPGSGGVLYAETPVAHRKGKERAEFGHILDSGVEEGREKDLGNGLFQRGNCMLNVRRHALEVLPLRLEELGKTGVGGLRVATLARA